MRVNQHLAHSACPVLPQQQHWMTKKWSRISVIKSAFADARDWPDQHKMTGKKATVTETAAFHKRGTQRNSYECIIRWTLKQMGFSSRKTTAEANSVILEQQTEASVKHCFIQTGLQGTGNCSDWGLDICMFLSFKEFSFVTVWQKRH